MFLFCDFIHDYIYILYNVLYSNLYIYTVCIHLSSFIILCIADMCHSAKAKLISCSNNSLDSNQGILV